MESRSEEIGYTSVKIPKALARQIDKVLSHRAYKSRTEFIIDAIRRRLDEIERLRK